MFIRAGSFLSRDFDKANLYALFPQTRQFLEVRVGVSRFYCDYLGVGGRFGVCLEQRQHEHGSVRVRNDDNLRIAGFGDQVVEGLSDEICEDEFLFHNSMKFANLLVTNFTLSVTE